MPHRKNNIVTRKNGRKFPDGNSGASCLSLETAAVVAGVDVSITPPSLATNFFQFGLPRNPDTTRSMCGTFYVSERSRWT
jgi:hypothetical protein